MRTARRHFRGGAHLLSQVVRIEGQQRADLKKAIGFAAPPGNAESAGLQPPGNPAVQIPAGVGEDSGGPFSLEDLAGADLEVAVVSVEEVSAEEAFPEAEEASAAVVPPVNVPPRPRTDSPRQHGRRPLSTRE